MRKLAGFLIFGLLAVFATACSEADSVPTSLVESEAPAVEGLPFIADAAPASALECTYKCIKCLPPNAAACEWKCVYIGKCESRCTEFQTCAEGFEWSEAACRCVPVPGPFN